MLLFYWRKRQNPPVSASTRVAKPSPAKITRAARALARNERGATALFLALAIVPLLAFVGLAVDTTRGYLVKSRLNQAIDAAVLAGGRVYASATRDDDIRMYFKANFPDGYMGAVVTPLVITPDDINKTLTVSAQATLPTTFMQLLDIDTIPVGSSAQVTIAAQNVEVALVLDITGSMAGSKIAGLQDAANTLVDIVVQDQQTPFYTKVAIIPYSQAVNVGAYAPQVRGAIVPGKAITGASKTNPVVITSVNHGFNNGDKVFITGVGGMTQIRNSMTASTTSTTSPQFWVVASATTDTFALTRINGSTANGTSWGNYSPSTGSIYCMTPGCQYQAYQNPSNNWRTHQVSTCVTERTGANAYTDAAPSVSPVGRNYPLSSDCVSIQIFPLSSDKTALHNMIDTLTASGSTAGHIGIAWGWYMLSPNFSYLWPSASQMPAAYGTPQLLKVAVIMTDGNFNTMYYNGVISQDATYGNASDRVNQDALNGDAYTQAQALCDAMKAPAPGPNIEIFTVGLELSNQAAIDIMNYCATDASHVYLPASGADMNAVFTDIAMKISRLRLSK